MIPSLMLMVLIKYARCSQKYVIFIISLSCPKFVHPHRKRQFLNTCPEPLLYAIRSNADAIANLTMQKEFTCHTFMELSQKKHTHTHTHTKRTTSKNSSFFKHHLKGTFRFGSRSAVRNLNITHITPIRATNLDGLFETVSNMSSTFFSSQDHLPNTTGICTNYTPNERRRSF